MGGRNVKAPVSSAGVQLPPSHVAAVQDFPRPGNPVRELQTFLGAVNYYRQFLCAVAQILKPLTSSLCGNLPGSNTVAWTPEYAAAKQALLRATWLAHPVSGTG